MNLKWAIVGFLLISCQNHSAPATSGTIGVAQTAPLDTSRPALYRPQRFIIDLNHDQIADTITIVSSKRDTGTFDTVHIAIAKFGDYIFHTDTVYPWTPVDDWFLDSNRNVLATNKLFLAKSKIHSVLLLFGNLDGAGDRDNFSIINIEDNVPRLVLDQNERGLYIEAPMSLSDLDGDGRLDFLYRQIFEYDGKPDTLGGKIGTYSPYFVYSVDSSCVLNKPLTIRYNKEHYVFAGFRYDEGVQVFYPNDGSQPRLWKK